MLGDTSAGVNDLTAGETETETETCLDSADDVEVSTKTVAGSDNGIHTQCSRTEQPQLINQQAKHNENSKV